MLNRPIANLIYEHRTKINEIEESKRWLDRETDESTYRRDFKKEIELLNFPH